MKPKLSASLDRAKLATNRYLGRSGFQIVKSERKLLEYDGLLRDQIAAVRPFTMTSPERIVASIESIEYIVKAELPGSICECGVWRGGMMMAMIGALQRLGVNDRDLYLYDTFEGMSEPTEVDRSVDGTLAADAMAASATTAIGAMGYTSFDDVRCIASVEDVMANVLSTGYPESRIHVVKGKVEDTIPGTLPDSIALLRLDTDWYESTRHELIHLFPLLSDGGVLLIDDYGHWEGAKRAVDEYLRDQDVNMLLHRVDSTGRTGIKTGPAKP